MHTPFGRVPVKSQSGMQPQVGEATLRDFSGGLNLVDADATIKSNFAKVLKNMHRDVDGTMSMRWGTRFKWDVSSAVAGTIIEQYYFNDKLVVVTADGEICTVDSAGTITAIWNDTIAGALVGSPDGWSTGLVTADFTEFKGELVVCNGVDKPLLIKADFTTTYLQDVATGSNVFTPIGRFVTTVNDYTVIAGVAATPFEIHISSKGTSGTWAGDADPNDALSINIGAYAPAAGGAIRGISSFRNYLLVHFAKQTVIIELGAYDESGNHTPTPLDTIPDYGIISHRMASTVEQNFVFADENGVQKSMRNQFGGALETEVLSDKIVPAYVAETPFTNADRFKSFAVTNKNEKRVMFFLFIEGVWHIYTMTYDKGLRKVAWSNFDGWDFDSGTASSRGRVFLSKGTKIYQYGNGVFEDEDYTADMIGDYDSVWTTATAYVAGDKVLHAGEVYEVLTNHTSDDFTTDLADEKLAIYEGEPITFDWELPWSDISARMRKKQVRYIGMDTEGTARFNVQCFVDNFYKKQNGDYNPAVETSFVAGNSPGYGGGDQPYGGGRRAIDERLWGFPLEFKIFKMRIYGSSRGRLKFSTLTILYKRGNYHR